MITLPTQFNQLGFTHTQLKRLGNAAIYERARIGGKARHYEVVVIGFHNGYEIAGNHIPPSEVYPSSSQWGQKGWTCATLDAAERRFVKLTR